MTAQEFFDKQADLLERATQHDINRAGRDRGKAGSACALFSMYYTWAADLRDKRIERESE